ncbi:MAG: cytochrome c biogenesis protein CcsA [Bacteroidales bacterium]|nr:cytochrome c biogenesis protein CcsA [Candidatus Cryptobacteroides equifaecalis]
MWNKEKIYFILPGVLLFALAIFMAVEGTWALALHESAVFLALSFLLMLSLAYVLWTFKGGSLSFRLNHWGILLICFGAFFGAPDLVDCQLPVGKEQSTHVGLTADGTPVPLPFELRLKEFRIDTYDDGVSPKQYTSVLDAGGKELVTSVNHPCWHKGYLIYQADYDHAAQSYSVLKCVRDPWLPFGIVGALLLAAGALLSTAFAWNSRAVLPLAIVLAIGFTAISLARINFGTLMPALRSYWFVPHLAAYMSAYSIMSLALICCVVSLWGNEKAAALASKLFRTSSALLILGMLCGAAWAKIAWGDYWTWDPKECWAAATWLFSLAGSHIRYNSKRGKILFLVAVTISFAAIQMTWYGVNYLPSAHTSIHVYNR